jgi:hypothetical protein
MVREFATYNYMLRTKGTWDSFRHGLCWWTHSRTGSTFIAHLRMIVSWWIPATSPKFHLEFGVSEFSISTPTRQRIRDVRGK